MSQLLTFSSRRLVSLVSGRSTILRSRIRTNVSNTWTLSRSCSVYPYHVLSCFETYGNGSSDQNISFTTASSTSSSSALSWMASTTTAAAATRTTLQKHHTTVLGEMKLPSAASRSSSTNGLLLYGTHPFSTFAKNPMNNNSFSHSFVNGGVFPWSPISHSMGASAGLSPSPTSHHLLSACTTRNMSTTPGFGYWWFNHSEGPKHKSWIENIRQFLYRLRRKLKSWWMRHRDINVFGRHISYSMSEIAGHLSFVLLAFSFGFKDMFWLRILALFAGISMMCFNFWHPHGKVQWLPLKWNAAFVFINLAHIIYLLVQEYRAHSLSDDEIRLYEEVFASTGLDRIKFMRLMRAGRWRNFVEGDQLTFEGQHNNLVYLMQSGSARVMVNDKRVYTLTEGQFIGEMGLHVGLHITSPVQSTASVVCNEPVRAIAWRRGVLIDLLEAFPEIAGAVQTVINADIVRKALDRDQKKHIEMAHQGSITRKKKFSHKNNLQAKKAAVQGEGVEPKGNNTNDANAIVQPAGDVIELTGMNEEEQRSIEIGDNQVSIQKAWQEKDLTMYQNLLLTILNDGNVSNHERGTLKRFRQIHFITDSEHSHILEKAGWSPDEYKQGYRKEQAAIYEAELKKQKKGPYSLLTRFMHGKDEDLPVLNNPFVKEKEEAASSQETE